MMTWTTQLWLVGGMMLVTFACRYPVLAFVSRVKLSPSVLDALQFVPPAVLTAIIAPAVLAPAGKLAVDLHNPAIFATLLCSWVAWRKQNLLLTIVVGMASWWAWRLVLLLF